MGGRVPSREESAEHPGERRWPGGCLVAKEDVEQPEGRRVVRRAQTSQQSTEPPSHVWPRTMAGGGCGSVFPEHPVSLTSMFLPSCGAEPASEVTQHGGPGSRTAHTSPPPPPPRRTCA